MSKTTGLDSNKRSKKGCGSHAKDKANLWPYLTSLTQILETDKLDQKRPTKLVLSG